MRVVVTDKFNVTRDVTMPCLVHCLNPTLMQHQLQARVQFTNTTDRFQLAAIRVIRHTPGSRCVIEYDGEITDRSGRKESRTILGKVNAMGLDTHAHELQEMLWENGFDNRSEDGVSVPRPISAVEELNMWLQEKVSGVPATQFLAEQRGSEIAERAANAIAKLHWAGIPARRRHTIDDEICILRDRLDHVKKSDGLLARRLDSIMDASKDLAATVEGSTVDGIHRDFHADQIIIDRDRLYIVDLDLYCEGDPALDIGNFLAHVMELSVRMFGNANALTHIANALKERFLLLVGGKKRHSIEVYATLSLGKHIFLSTQLPERHHTTERLLELCEQRLGLSGFPFSSGATNNLTTGLGIS